ncbi:hypothetical protein L210DRAFT_358687 [Boletus edulis BED1]|uniref:Uncharacterized protein n=1 Tax=Boletus edulis BED1 TaxID=1328754 RepID=A0AAD4GB84_BOLED|nr:hypothetical protein L210DRAFT_358687 [Boletus edulis BED1]
MINVIRSSDMKSSVSRPKCGGVLPKNVNTFNKALSLSRILWDFRKTLFMPLEPRSRQARYWIAIFYASFQIMGGIVTCLWRGGTLCS